MFGFGGTGGEDGFGRGSAERRPSGRAGFEKPASLGLDNRDEGTREHQRLVFLAFVVGQCAFVGFPGEILDTCLSGFGCANVSQSICDLCREAST